MTIEFPCRCGHTFQLPEDQAGLDIQCPSCGLLNAIPTHDDLLAIGNDGTYNVESGPEVPNAELASELAWVYHRGPLDPTGNEKNLKLTTADINAIDGQTIPLAPDTPTLEQAPRYDPETGELITPLELKADGREHVDPSTIPMARAAINYATAHTSRRSSFTHAFIHLFTPGNVAVMLAVLCMHVVLFPVIFVTFMGIFIIAPFLLAFVAGLFAHYTNIVEDVGVFEKDELPRPFRDLSWYEDLWHPFASMMASLVICYLPGIIFLLAATANGHMRLGITVNFIWEAAGTFFFPAVLMSLHCSGTILNVRPDRVLGVIAECGAGYFVVIVAWILGATVYLWGILGTTLALLNMMDPLSWPRWMTDWAIVMPALAVGLFLMHYFSVCLGLLYRAHHGAFPWILQRHIPTGKFAHDGPALRPVATSAEPQRIRNAIPITDERRSAAAERHDVNPLLGRWVLVRKGSNGHAPEGTEFVLKPDGRLDYISTNNDQFRIMHLAYRLEGQYIVSMQLPGSKEVRTRWQFDGTGNLVLELNGQRATFRRALKDEDAVA